MYVYVKMRCFRIGGDALRYLFSRRAFNHLQGWVIGFEVTEWYGDRHIPSCSACYRICGHCFVGVRYQGMEGAANHRLHGQFGFSKLTDRKVTPSPGVVE